MRLVETVELGTVNKGRSLTLVKEAVLQELKQRSVYQENLLYRGLDSQFLQNILSWGTENEDAWGIYALPESFLSIDPDPRWINPLSYALASGCLAVYDGDCLRLGENCTDWYEFNDQTRKHEAVVAVFTMKDII